MGLWCVCSVATSHLVPVPLLSELPAISLVPSECWTPPGMPFVIDSDHKCDYLDRPKWQKSSSLVASVSLLFVNDVVLLGSSHGRLNLTLEWFTAECEVAEMKMSNSQPEGIFLRGKRVD